jgi:hypothetical protein
MELTLTNDEAETLRGLLNDSLPGMKFEIARTRDKELLHALMKREALCEALLGRLDRVAAVSQKA